MPPWAIYGNERTRGPVVPGAAGPTYTGPGDVVSGASAWWGLRGYNGAYATGSNPALDLNNDSTGAFAGTVNINSDGTLDSVTAASLIAGGASHVSKLYDQTGNGKHLTQATLANMPVLAVSGSPFTLTFDGTASSLLLASAVLSSLPYSLVVFVKPTLRNGTERTILSISNSGNTNPLNRIAHDGGGIGCKALGQFRGVNAAALTAIGTVTLSDVVWYSLASTADASAASVVFTDGANKQTTSGAADSMSAVDSTTMGYLRRTTDSNFWGGPINEGGIWGSVVSDANIAALSANSHTFWGV